MKLLKLLTILALCVGCASETEKKSLDIVAEVYHAKTSYSKDFNSALGQETIRRFNITVAESNLIDSLPPAVTSGNIALLLYDGFTAKEREKYTGIDVELINLKQDTASYFYRKEVLAKLSRKAKIYKQFSESLVAGDFQKATNHMSAELKSNPAIASGIESKIRQDNEQNGKLRSYTPFGISEVADADYIMVQFQGFLNYFNGKQIRYFINVNDADNDDTILGFRLAK